ncbi:glycosyltransferase [Candidatus Gottesmanbacteria bacterium]|nr:glycosyltransferase [Candidatus Gottesmanbacteria bacterium]
MKLSVTLAVYNEEKTLARCLESVKDIAGEIIIVDGRSQDNTVKIVKKYGAKIFEAINDPINFHKQKKLANDKATGEWILQLDADEVVSLYFASVSAGKRESSGSSCS